MFCSLFLIEPLSYGWKRPEEERKGAKSGSFEDLSETSVKEEGTIKISNRIFNIVKITIAEASKL